MAFTIRGINGLSDRAATRYVDKALTYLRQSLLARNILEDLENHADVCIDVDRSGEPFYAHPESSYDTITSGGTAVWNPTKSVKTTDSANMRGWDGGIVSDGSPNTGRYLAGEMKTTPDASWIPKHFEQVEVQVQKRGLALRLAKAFHLSQTRTELQPGTKRVKSFGTLSAPMCLMHELGHALQYATFPGEYVGIKGWDSKSHAQSALEQTNLQCVEIPVALELKSLGHPETPRWDYGHTGHQ